MQKTILVASLGIVVLAGILWVSGVFSAPEDSRPSERRRRRQTDEIVKIERAFERSDFQLALTLADEALKKQPGKADMLLIAGNAATQIGELERASQYYSAIAKTETQWLEANATLAQIYLTTCELSKAEEVLKSVNRARPTDIETADRLAILLVSTGRYWEARPYLNQVIFSGEADFERLVYGSIQGDRITNTAQLNECAATKPLDALPALGLGIAAIEASDIENAREFLSKVCRQRPDLTEAWVQLARSYLANPSTVSSSKWRHWNSTTPNNAAEHPGSWEAVGRLAEIEKLIDEAIYCYARAIQIDPYRTPTAIRLMALLNTKGRGDSELARRVTQLTQHDALLSTVEQNPESARNIILLITKCAEIGKTGASQGWSRYLASITQGKSVLNPQLDLTWPEKTRQFASDLIASRTLALSDVVNRATQAIDLVQTDGVPANVETDEVRLKFQNVAQELGVDFRFFPGREEPIIGRRMHEFTGAGVGVVDYDNDGRADLFFPQGASWPTDSAGPRVAKEFRDRLFRNLETDVGQMTYIPIEEAARLESYDFGQGVQAADINNDGFMDIYLTGIGDNSLWVNMGDGTFTEVVLPPSNAWSTSSALIDVNGDGNLDIYDANYVQGSDVFSRKCPVAGQPRVCSPLAFKPALNRLLESQGDLTFRATEIKNQDAGNSLGLLGFRESNNSRSGSLFVANDQVANAFYRFALPANEGASGLLSDDEGLIYGVALDERGSPQACMGIAAGDVNGDGRFDLFVTNFYEESNTLYLQGEGGVFSDQTQLYGLRKDSLEQLGFGCEFADFDLDGDLDLIVANGNIDDATHVGRPFRMQPQLFANQGDAGFVMVEQKDLGPFFEDFTLGRGLAIGDFNRDGKVDFVVSHLVDPAAVVINQSQTSNRVLVIQCVGTNTSRDGTGSPRDGTGCIAILDMGPQFPFQARQVFAGDGYLSSNEKLLRFSIPNGPVAGKLTVSWPSGKEQIIPMSDLKQLQDAQRVIELVIVEPTD